MSRTKPVKRQNTVFPYRGKWRIQYFDQHGRIRTKVAESQADAYKKLALLEQKVSQGSLAGFVGEIPMLGDWALAWLSKREHDIRPVSFWALQTAFRLHILPSLGCLRLDQISMIQIGNLYRELSLSKNLAPGTVLKVHIALSQCLKAALESGFIATNPATRVKPPRAKAPKVQVFTPLEVTQILNMARLEGPLSEFRWLLALRFGLRQGECLALNWSDLDLQRRSISITKTVNSIPGRGFVVSEPKSEQSRREIPLDEYTISLVARIRPEIEASAWDSLIFRSTTGGFLDARTDYDRWRRLLKKSGLAHMKLHAARHTAGTMLLESGADVRTIQLLLGHSSPGFTMATYLHPSQESLRASLEAVGHFQGSK